MDGGKGDLGSSIREESVTRSEWQRGDSVDTRLVDSSYIALLPAGLRHSRRGMSLGEGRGVNRGVNGPVYGPVGFRLGIGASERVRVRR